MDFYFCEGCGKRITDKDLDAGLGKNKKLKGVYCKGCAIGVTTMETLPMTDEAAKELLKTSGAPPTTGTQVVPKRRRRTSAVSLPSGSSSTTGKGGAASSRKQSFDHAGRTKQEKSSSPLVLAGLGGLAAIIVVVMFALSSSPKNESAKSPSSVKQHSSDASKKSIPKLSSTVKATPKSAPSDPLPTQKLPVAEESDPYQLLEAAFGALPADDFEGRIKLAEVFLKDYADHMAGPRLGVTLAQWRKNLATLVTSPSSQSKSNPEKEPSTPEATGSNVEVVKAPNSQKEIAKSVKPKAPPYEALYFKRLDQLLGALKLNDFEQTKSLAEKLASDAALGEWQIAAKATPEVVALFPKQQAERLAKLKKLVGRNLSLQTTKGARKGVVSKVSATELTLQQHYTINGKKKIGATFTVPMNTLSAKSLARYASGPRPSASPEWLALALRALADDLLAEADVALKNCADHSMGVPLTKYLAKKMSDLREQDAALGWKKLLARSDSATTTKQVEKLQADLAEFSSSFTGTDFVVRHTTAYEMLKSDLEKRTLRSRSLMAELFKGHIADYDVKTGIVKLFYDFKQKAQGHDFVFCRGASETIGKGVMALSGGKEVQMRFYTDRFDLDAFEVTFKISMATIREEYSWALMTLGRSKKLALLFKGSSISLRRRGNPSEKNPILGYETLHEAKVDGSADVLVSLRRENGKIELSLDGTVVHEVSDTFTLSGNRIAFFTRADTGLRFKSFTFKASPSRTWLKEQLLFQAARKQMTRNVNVWVAKVNGKWSDAANWSLQRPPQAGDHVVFDKSAISDCRADPGSVASPLGSLTLTPGYSGTLRFAPSFGVSESQVFEVSDGIFALGGTWVVSGLVTGVDKEWVGEGVTIKASRFVLGHSATLHSNGLGFPALRTPSVGINGGYRHGDPRAPITLGPSSKGGSGGGAIKIDVSSGDLFINGILSANAILHNTSHVNGAGGGSLYLIGAALQGNGSIAANSTNGIGDGRGGEGGRIAVEADVSEFSGSFECRGGRKGRGMFTRDGRPGSVVLPPRSNLTVVSSMGLPPGKHIFNKLVIKNGGTLVCHPNLKEQTGVHLEVSTLTIEAGGHLSADFEGLPALAKGRRNPEKIKRAPSGGPVSLGGGGKSNWGGGAIRIDAKKVIVEGHLSANGESTTRTFTSGGSGGSVWLTCELLNGGGSIQANSGNATCRGGQIVITYRDGSFTGKTSASGRASKTAGIIIVNGKRVVK